MLRNDGTAAPTRPGLAEYFEHLVRPVSAGFAIPVFAFFAAGTFGGYDGLVTALSNPIALGIVAGLVVGKTIGVFGTTRLLGRSPTRASTRRCAGSMFSECRCWPGSDSRYPC